ncbi:hypothetical protein J6X90_03470 [Candidatus Saccharibacteria bacterium]|nr:hypothetical protein [Candidatus Saccharibacteria bacterium]
MKKKVYGLLTAFLSSLFVTSPVFAAECPPTAILTVTNCDKGEAIYELLGIGLNVVTYGVGAAAVIGVLIAGYQYMTARDNPAQVAKAKNRILQIVIGLAIWVLIWGILQFLLPGGLFADGS